MHNPKRNKKQENADKVIFVSNGLNAKHLGGNGKESKPIPSDRAQQLVDAGWGEIKKVSKK